MSPFSYPMLRLTRYLLIKQVDFGLWTPEQKQVTKEKVPARITACAWSVDGSMLAIGMINGSISIRNQQAEEIQKFERRAPIWCMVFIPDFYPVKQSNANSAGNTGMPENSELLAIGCWDKTYSLYRFDLFLSIEGNVISICRNFRDRYLLSRVNSSSYKLQTEKQLKYYPCGMSYAVNQSSKSTYVVSVLQLPDKLRFSSAANLNFYLLAYFRIEPQGYTLFAGRGEIG